MEKEHGNNHSELFSTTAQQGPRKKGFRWKEKKKHISTMHFLVPFPQGQAARWKMEK